MYGKDNELASDIILLANLCGIRTSRSRKTAIRAIVTTAKNNNNEMKRVTIHRVTEELASENNKFLKNFLKIYIFSFKYFHPT